MPSVQFANPLIQNPYHARSNENTPLLGVKKSIESQTCALKKNNKADMRSSYCGLSLFLRLFQKSEPKLDTLLHNGEIHHSVFKTLDQWERYCFGLDGTSSNEPKLSQRAIKKIVKVFLAVESLPAGSSTAERTRVINTLNKVLQKNLRWDLQSRAFTHMKNLMRVSHTLFNQLEDYIHMTSQIIDGNTNNQLLNVKLQDPVFLKKIHLDQVWNHHRIIAKLNHGLVQLGLEPKDFKLHFVSRTRSDQHQEQARQLAYYYTRLHNQIRLLESPDFNDEMQVPTSVHIDEIHSSSVG